MGCTGVGCQGTEGVDSGRGVSPDYSRVRVICAHLDATNFQPLTELNLVLPTEKISSPYFLLLSFRLYSSESESRPG